MNVLLMGLSLLFLGGQGKPPSTPYTPEHTAFQDLGVCISRYASYREPCPTGGTFTKDTEFWWVSNSRFRIRDYSVLTNHNQALGVETGTTTTTLLEVPWSNITKIEVRHRNPDGKESFLNVLGNITFTFQKPITGQTRVVSTRAYLNPEMADRNSQQTEFGSKQMSIFALWFATDRDEDRTLKSLQGVLLKLNLSIPVTEVKPEK